eukprot:COSAG03_NODE_17283_length_379_cov_0.910714_1_plen_28_part_01
MENPQPVTPHLYERRTRQVLTAEDAAYN